MDSTHIRWLEERLEKYSWKVLKAENGKIEKDQESMTEKRNQRKLLWFQAGGALNFITAAPHCGECTKCTYAYLILVREAQVGVFMQSLHVFDEAD
jgi:hypothetical protein